MAKLPPKPMNIVHEYFPVGTDGHSPMNYIDKGDPLNKNDYYSKNPIVDDPDNPGKKIRKADLEARQKSQRVEVGEGASNELNEVVLTPKKK
tara:strand:+ start:41 stop:316 length:276 start_codon:yes stop_codon:yes gene_type:complete